MNKRYKKYNDRQLTVTYRGLGTISMKELTDAVVEDIHALQDLYNIHYVTAGCLIVPATNQYGDPLRVIHPDGHPVTRINTHHYRPMCMDYDP